MSTKSSVRFRKKTNSTKYPIWVRIGLVGIYSKKTALGFFWLCIVISIISFVLGFTNNKFFYGVLFLAAALCYWLCIRWVDKNSKWEK